MYACLETLTLDFLFRQVKHATAIRRRFDCGSTASGCDSTLPREALGAIIAVGWF